jgi:hypothetical protein
MAYDLDHMRPMSLGLWVAPTQELDGHHMRYLMMVAATSAAFVAAVGMALAQHQGHHDHKGHNAPTADARVLVNMPPELVEHTLANMRDHLLALQQISEALALGKNDRAATTAEQKLGMTSLRLHGAHEVAKYMPEGMQQAGTAMHRAASRFAIEAQNSDVTGDLKPALAILSEVMNACVACHAGYRFK